MPGHETMFRMLDETVRLRELAQSVTPTQIVGFLRHPEVLDLLACQLFLPADQISLIVDILDRDHPSNRTAIAYHLALCQRPTPSQVERLARYVDDPATWLLLCDQYPGGEPALRRWTPQWIVERYATDSGKDDVRVES